MKKIILTILMCIATLPLIILLIIGAWRGNFWPTFMLGLPFIVLGIGTLYLKFKSINKKEVIKID